MYHIQHKKTKWNYLTEKQWRSITQVVMMMTGLYLAVGVLRASALVSKISSWMTAEVSFVCVLAVTASDSVGLTLKGLLGTLTPPQVTASVCLTAEVGVYEQE